ncbi:helix-turn-helix transcriptional regulator [Streptomyces sp. I05A-00742]|uniref:helix-turn-helix domain-containing protein n=1 Tax=Streptomyces sp. I05A-00742 TaxID=2732853 RepID=UPI001489D318|nr:helix-turn-helix transcriptional regulator [Streptomyces sp. I05A-00742]
MSGNRQAKSASMRMFGSQLQGWRRIAGVSREQLAEAAGYSLDTVCSVEQGRRVPPPELVEAAEELCGAGGLLREAARHIERSKFPDWFEDYARHEADAAFLGIYHNHVVPGLFQTEDYARAVFRSGRPLLDDDEVERRLAARMERQQLLHRSPAAVISVVLEQVTLERPLGGRQVMRGQVEYLLRLSELRNVDVQVMLTRRESHACLAGPLYVLETRDQRRLAYFEGQKGSVLLSEPKDVSDLNMRYGILRSQALTPEDTVSFLETVLGEL